MGYRQVFGDEGLGDINGTVTSLPAGMALGEVRWNETGTKKYRLFYNAGGASIPTYNVFQRSFGGTSLYSVTVTTTTETGCTAAAGAMQGNKTVTTGAYFWGAVYGHPFSLISATVTIATGNGVCMEGTSGGGKCMKATIPSNNAMAYNVGDATSANGGDISVAGGVGTRFFLLFEDVPAWAKSLVGGV